MTTHVYESTKTLTHRNISGDEKLAINVCVETRQKLEVGEGRKREERSVSDNTDGDASLSLGVDVDVHTSVKGPASDSCVDEVSILVETNGRQLNGLVSLQMEVSKSRGSVPIIVKA